MQLCYTDTTPSHHTSNDECLKDKTPEQAKETILIRNKQDLITQYPDFFNGIGKFQGEYHIIVHPNVPPVIHPPRLVLISLKDDKITKPEEDELPPWVNIVAYRRKQNGSFRLRLDPKDLDEAFQRVHHVTPSLKEILPKFIGGTVFSIVDAKLGYWKVVPDKDSSYLTHR